MFEVGTGERVVRRFGPAAGGHARAPGPRRFETGEVDAARQHFRDFSDGRIRLTGFAAWSLWGVAHVYFLIGLRNRAVVALNWLWSYLTFQRGARLITGGGP